MADRVVLGCGSIGRRVVGSLDDRSGDLLVIDRDRDRVETLREEGVAAEHGDPTDPGVLRSLGSPVGTVLVGGDDPATNGAAARTAREVFPGALLVAYAGADPDDADREGIEAVADRVIDPGRAVAGSLLDRIADDAGERLHRLSAVLRRIEGSLGVFMHDNPDPDAIGSAVALRDLARRLGVDADACYFGEIAHQENRAMVNLLDLTLVDLDPVAFDPDAYDAVALVDHSRPGVNDQLPEDVDVDVVIDHHPPRDAVSAAFVDLNSDVGATSTLLTDYLRRSGLEAGTSVATALLYGIRVDTRDFHREITEADFDAAAYLLPRADVDVLERIENPTVAASTFDTIAAAIESRRRRGPVLVAGVGPISNRDALAQAADRLLDMEGITTTMVYGFMDGTVYASARARGTDLDVGETMRQAFDQIGSAGGHTDMAGAQLPLGILGAVEEEATESLDAVVADVITNRFFEVIGLQRVLEVPDAGDAAPSDG